MKSVQSEVKLVRGIESQLIRKKLNHHNMQISDNQCLEKVFKNLRKKLNRSENEKILDLKTVLFIDLEVMYVINDDVTCRPF